jgi:HlyD family secretion protein
MSVMSKLEHLKSNRKKIAPVILLLVIIAGVVYYNFAREASYIGQAEAVVTTNPSEVSGKIIESNITLGQEIAAGDVIAVIDSKDLKYALEQLQLNLEKARIINSDAKTGQGGRAESGVAAAQAAYNGALAAANQANQDYQKALALYQDNAVSESALLSTKLVADTANSGLAAAKAQLDLAQNNSAGSVSESTSVDILLLESMVAQQKDMIEKCVVKAGTGGTVISKNYGLGDYVAPGYDIADVSSESEKYLVFYYPKEKISGIQYGQEIAFIYNREEYKGAVKFIDVKPRYTPQDFQTQANKNRESVKVKILIPESCPMKPGETARVLL